MQKCGDEGENEQKRMEANQANRMCPFPSLVPCIPYRTEERAVSLAL